MIVGIPRETHPGEHRVALVPEAAAGLVGLGLEVLVESGAGAAAGFVDSAYVERGAALADGRADLFARADIVLQVRTMGASPEAGRADLDHLRQGQIVIGAAEPLGDIAPLRAMAQRGVTLFAMELMPRITRAQSMDILSSMATIAGYKAVLMAAAHLPRIFPLLMTAAGTLTPARVLIVGAGVAGLQAIATARRLGATVQAYDVRAAVKEQIESLGAKFVELDIDAGDSEDAGGYAKAQDESFYDRQREALGKVVAQSDVVITTAAIPGKTSPLLVTAEAVRAMAPGSVIVDLAAERGGNCALSKAGEEVVEGGVQIIAPLNLPASVPYHASQMYSHNIATFLKHLYDAEEGIKCDVEDEITGATLVARGGDIVHPRLLDSVAKED